MGSYWRGRRMGYDPDKQVIERERQRWVMEKLTASNTIIQELTVDPDRAYADWRDDYLRTGNETSLRMMLEYVRG